MIVSLIVSFAQRQAPRRGLSGFTFLDDIRARLPALSRFDNTTAYVIGVFDGKSFWPISAVFCEILLGVF
jgi:hypothetical protein